MENFHRIRGMREELDFSRNPLSRMDLKIRCVSYVSFGNAGALSIGV
jgi:hypothetical protein